MIDSNTTDLHEALAAPFTTADLEWKVQTCGKKADRIWALVVPYLSARAIQSRLDDTVGPGRWRNRYEPIREGEKTIGFLCYLAINVDGEWVEKCDGAELTDIEPVKGGLSNALKRAAVQWGLGRYLYDLDTCWANVHEGGKHRAKTKDDTWFNWDPPANAAPAPAARAQPAAQQQATAPAAPKAEQPKAPAQQPTAQMGDANALAAKTAHGFLVKTAGKAFADLVWRAARKGDVADRIDLLTKANESIGTIYEVLGGRGEELVTELLRREKPAREIVDDLARAALGEVPATTAKDA